MSNIFLVVVLIAAFAGLGAIAMIIDGGVSDQQKKWLTYGLGGLLAIVAITFYVVEDRSSFNYGMPDTGAKKGGGQKQGGKRSGGGGGGGEAAEEKAEEKEEKDEKSGGGGISEAGEVMKGKDCEECPSMVPVPGGTAVLGTMFHETSGRGPSLAPMRELRVLRFAISRSEITVRQFNYFMKQTGYKPSAKCRLEGQANRWGTVADPGFAQTEDHPIVCVTWYDAEAYANWLTTKTNKPYALPTEAQWEFAARAGSMESFNTGKQIHPAQALFRTHGDQRVGTTMIASYPPNRHGIYDVHGNAAELVKDCMQNDVQLASTGAGDCARRMAKGGAWYQAASHLHAASRWPVDPSVADNGIGFRVARAEQ